MAKGGFRQAAADRGKQSTHQFRGPAVHRSNRIRLIAALKTAGGRLSLQRTNAAGVQVKGVGHRRPEAGRPGGEATRAEATGQEAARAEDATTHATALQGGPAQRRRVAPSQSHEGVSLSLVCSLRVECVRIVFVLRDLAGWRPCPCNNR